MDAINTYLDYKLYLTDYIKSLPNEGRGELGRMAKHINANPTLLSLVLKGERDLTVEQAFDLSNYLNLSESEGEYFYWMVQHQRAGHFRYKHFAKKKMEILSRDMGKVSKKVKYETTLTDEQKAIYYSSWLYSAIRMYTSVKESGVTVSDICKRFKLDKPQAEEILTFLLDIKLIISEDKKHFKMGPQRTFLEKGSPHLLKHHAHWRIKALGLCDRHHDDNFTITAPMSVSKKDFNKLKSELTNWLQSFSETIKDTQPEEIACLNLDLFWLEE